ncbi:MAG: membrane protein insertase YidC [Deltaproteobacteria bacterium]|jgi:YidC/Oxa1 family membrane protein insertase|nr:membrane protein insertase YidC [Deltaproteobacteria bacterium]
MDRRVVVTMLVMMGFFMAVSYIYPIIFPPPPKARVQEGPAPAGPSLRGGELAVSPGQAQAPPPQGAAPGGEAPAPPPPARDVVVDTPWYRAVLTEDGARLKSFALKEYKSYKTNPDLPDKDQELVNPPGEPGAPRDYPLNIVFLNNQEQQGVRDELQEDLRDFRFEADRLELSVPEGGEGRVTFTGLTSEGMSIKRVYTFKAGSYRISQELVLRNQGQRTFFGRLGMGLSSWPFSTQQNRYNVMTGYLNGSFLSESVDDAQEELEDLGPINQASFLGYMDQYFLAAMLFPEDGAPGLEPTSLRVTGKELRGRGVRLTAYWPLHIPPGSEASYPFDIYYGPKEQKSLEDAGNQLSRSVDLGWFALLAKPLAWLLRFFYGFVGNYGVAIILVTILIKIILWPLTAKSYKSMKQMQKLQPRIKQLREKYKDDPQTMNKEMLQLYRTFKVSPLGGCLPMILQIPFFIAFYRVLDYALELRGAPFALWIHDLSAPDRLFHFNFSIPFVSQPTGIPVLTLLMGATMIWQQRMTPSMGDQMQAKIMMLLPIIFIVALLNMPAGLVLYWLVNNILSIFQQKLINRPEKGEGEGKTGKADAKTAKADAKPAKADAKPGKA